MKIIVRTEQDRNRLREIVVGMSIDTPKEVVVNEHKANRSVSQNALMWKWITVIASELGETKEEVHERYKERFLVPIFRRDDTEYSSMIEAVIAVHRSGLRNEAKRLKVEIVRLTSTTKMNVQQFTEYLNDIDADARSMNLQLPKPEDLYREAFGLAK